MAEVKEARGLATKIILPKIDLKSLLKRPLKRSPVTKDRAGATDAKEIPAPGRGRSQRRQQAARPENDATRGHAAAEKKGDMRPTAYRPPCRGIERSGLAAEKKCRPACGGAR